MTESRRCAACGATVPESAPGGLCPRCLLAAGFESRPGPATVPPTEASPAASRGFVPPTPAELATRFPHLEIHELLGSGGMGAVYKARQTALDRPVAVKILPPEVGRDPAFAERFTREARALARLSHPRIVAVHDFGRTADGLFYFVMEYVDGVNLRQALRAGTITPAAALSIVPQICEALQYAHDEGVVHRDIKPENVLLDTRGRVKIADFGLAKLLGQESADHALTATEQVMGTLKYMAPEQLEGARAVDHRADIYSLGVVFYELLTGELPLGRFALPSQKVQIDVRLDEVVLRALERAPEQRYQHAAEIKTDVERVTLGPHPTAAKPTPRAAAARVADDSGRTFAMQTMPRDGRDALWGLVTTPAIGLMYYLVPALFTYLVCSGLGLSGEALLLTTLNVPLVFLLGVFVVLASGSVQGVRLDAEGLTILRYLGPSRSVPWDAVRRIEPMTPWEVFREVWLVPGLPPRGSIVGMTGRDYFRIRGQGDCWYFAPRHAATFLEAVEHFRSGGAAAPLPEPEDHESRAAQVRHTIGWPAFGLLMVAMFYVVEAAGQFVLVWYVGSALPRGPWDLSRTETATLFLVMGAVTAGGGLRMWWLGSYRAALVAAVAACLPVGFLGLEGLWFLHATAVAGGVWALVTLLRNDVRQAFAQRAAERQAAVQPPAATSWPAAASVAAPPVVNSPSAALPPGAAAQVLVIGAMLFFSLLVVLAGVGLGIFGILHAAPGSHEFWGWMGAALGCTFGGLGSLAGCWNGYRQLVGAEDLLKSPRWTWFDSGTAALGCLGLAALAALALNWTTANEATRHALLVLGGVTTLQGGLFQLLRWPVRAAARAAGVSAAPPQFTPPPASAGRRLLQGLLWLVAFAGAVVFLSFEYRAEQAVSKTSTTTTTHVTTVGAIDPWLVWRREERAVNGAAPRSVAPSGGVVPAGTATGPAPADSAAAGSPPPAGTSAGTVILSGSSQVNLLTWSCWALALAVVAAAGATRLDREDAGSVAQDRVWWQSWLAGNGGLLALYSVPIVLRTWLGV